MVAPSQHECVFLEKYAVAPSPSRDYYGIKVTRNQVYLYIWKITRRPNIFPILHKESMENFLQDSTAQHEVNYIFGQETLRDTLKIAYGIQDYLSHLPSNTLHKILRLVNLKDLAALAQTCKRLAQEIKRSEVWRQMHHKHCKRSRNHEEKKKVEKSGSKRHIKAPESRPSSSPSVSTHSSRSSLTRALIPQKKSGVSSPFTSEITFKKKPEVLESKKKEKNGLVTGKQPLKKQEDTRNKEITTKVYIKKPIRSKNSTVSLGTVKEKEKESVKKAQSTNMADAAINRIYPPVIKSNKFLKK